MLSVRIPTVLTQWACQQAKPMMLDLSPRKTLIDCSGEGHILAKEIEPSQEKEEHTANT